MSLAPGGVKHKPAPKRRTHDPTLPEFNPPWLQDVSEAKLRRLWKSRKRPFYATVTARQHIRIYGVERFFREYREEILFGDDWENDMKDLQATLDDDRIEAERVATMRTLLRAQRHAYFIELQKHKFLRNAHATHVDRFVFSVDSVRPRSCKLTPVSGYSSQEYRLVHGGVMRLVRKRSGKGARPTPLPPDMCVVPGELARCARLDCIEATVFGALYEANLTKVLGDLGGHKEPPIARFISHKLYDKNLWRLIAALL